MTSIFCRIIAGEIPSYFVYEDEKVFAFLDIHPVQLWHVLVVPKKEIADILEMDDALLSSIILTAKNIIAPAIKHVTKCERIGFSVEGLWVKDHMHLHPIPLHQIGDMDPSLAHTEEAEKMQDIAHKIQEEIAHRANK